MIREAIYYKKHNQLTLWTSRNTQETTYCPRLKQAKMSIQMVELTNGTKQRLTIC